MESAERGTEETRTEEHVEAKPQAIQADSGALSAPASSEPMPSPPHRETETNSEGALIVDFKLWHRGRGV